MMIKLKPTKNKEPAEYKSLYIKKSLVEIIEKIAKDNKIISMIEMCIDK